MSKNTEAKVYDKNFLKSLDLISHSMIVFDKAYNYYHQFAVWTQIQVFFVTRLKMNAIRTQVWCTLIAQLLLTVIQKIAQPKKAFSVVSALVRMHLISMLDVCELLRNTNRG